MSDKRYLEIEDCLTCVFGDQLPVDPVGNGGEFICSYPGACHESLADLLAPVIQKLEGLGNLWHGADNEIYRAMGFGVDRAKDILDSFCNGTLEGEK